MEFMRPVNGDKHREVSESKGNARQFAFRTILEVELLVEIGAHARDEPAILQIQKLTKSVTFVGGKGNGIGIGNA
ncbi:hypothetical protein XI06_22955 [Bradyrhizobium sp. CCBAU 11434]|nr:hypothetical protein [Bradyrhizobium sp. CCBAU 11434]